MESLFVNDLLLQNAYYKCPFINKVWIFIPILQMLMQMNIKEGNNRIIYILHPHAWQSISCFQHVELHPIFIVCIH
jgi:hypothetical protein